MADRSSGLISESKAAPASASAESALEPIRGEVYDMTVGLARYPTTLLAQAHQFSTAFFPSIRSNTSTCVPAPNATALDFLESGLARIKADPHSLQVTASIAGRSSAGK